MKKLAFNKLPKISVIIPVLNEEKKISDCLESVVVQDYPRKLLEIIVIDDGSTDKTVQIARKFGAKVYYNGAKNIERGKSIGLSRATNEYVFLLDADNRLPHTGWLSKLIVSMQENPQVVGGEAIWFKYDSTHGLVDRYCELFGINDPMAFYFNRRDRLMAIEDRWNLPGELLKETSDYYLIKFSRSNLLTVGSQGFLTKKSLLFKTNWQPYLFHMDSNMDLIDLGFNQYLMMKDSILHLHSQSIGQFIKKLQRNFILFLKQEPIRRYTWRTRPLKLFLVTLSMITVIRPTIDSLRGFIKKPDLAWFLHPLFSLVIPLVYIFYVVRGVQFKKVIKFDGTD